MLLLWLLTLLWLLALMVPRVGRGCGSPALDRTRGEVSTSRCPRCEVTPPVPLPLPPAPRCCGAGTPGVPSPAVTAAVAVEGSCGPPSPSFIDMLREVHPCRIQFGEGWVVTLESATCSLRAEQQSSLPGDTKAICEIGITRKPR